MYGVEQVKLAVRLNPEKRPKKKRKIRAKAKGGGGRSAFGQRQPKQPHSSGMIQAAMADGSVDEEECRAIFRKFDADGSGELDTKELTGVIIQILKALQNKLCATITRNNRADALKDVATVQESFKEQIVHYQSEEGMAELSAGFDPDSDGSISEDEFLAAFPDFLSFLLGGSTPNGESELECEPQPQPEPELQDNPDATKAAIDARRDTGRHDAEAARLQQHMDARRADMEHTMAARKHEQEMEHRQQVHAQQLRQQRAQAKAQAELAQSKPQKEKPTK